METEETLLSFVLAQAGYRIVLMNSLCFALRRHDDDKKMNTKYNLKWLACVAKTIRQSRLDWTNSVYEAYCMGIGWVGPYRFLV
jgi:hypothetical protein